MRKVVVGFSGGVTSAWCAGWALRTFPREEVILLFHDTKAEDSRPLGAHHMGTADGVVGEE